MKYLHLSEAFVLHELSFAKGLQYQAAVINMEGGNFQFIRSNNDIELNMNSFNNILKNVEDVFGE